MVAKFLDHNKREFLNGDGEQRKSDRFTGSYVTGVKIDNLNLTGS